MAAAFRPVNSPMASDLKMEETATATVTATATTPQPDTDGETQPVEAMDDAKTPTTATFGSAMAAQKPLPSSPFPQAVQMPESTEKKGPQRENSQHSAKSGDSDDVDMDESEGEGAGEDGAGSDDESVNADGSRSNKKKKSQRFYCTDYPPCNLSFTRSEHLARHIRKHTGERPFQCHCSRRFSRLDNLRQHAQTVHVNEDIPIDSLAATGTRFQRQIRTDRVVRQSGSRARASTAGSTGPTGRGHSKSLSTSSITSIGSIGSAYSPREEVRRRPPPLVMADPRSRLSLESYRSAAEGPFVYRTVSPTDFSTPTSGTFSTTGQNSPRWGSGVASPTSSHSRSHSMYAGSRTPGRRLSVPSGGNPFQSPLGANISRPLFGPGQANTASPATYSPGNSSLLASPTTSTTSGWSRRESMSRAADEEWRRRTWHPDTSNFNGASRLSNVITSSQFTVSPAPLPVSDTTNQSQQMRLPGIESFDDLPRPATPPRRNPSPMMIDTDTANPPALLPATASMSDDRRNVAVWDMGLHRGLTRLDINTPPRDGAGEWASEATQALHAQAEQAQMNATAPQPARVPTVRFEDVKTGPVQQALAQAQASPPSATAFRAQHQHTMSAPSITTPREMKRYGWYHGAVTVHPARGPVPDRGPQVDRMVHPNLVNGFAGFPVREQPAVQSSPRETEMGHHPPLVSSDPQMRRLEALVAVATSESSATTAY